MAANPPVRRRIAARIGLPHLLLLAFVLRLASLTAPTIVHPDEIYQYLEPAHRWLFGYGIVTWEWRYDIRSWLIPMLVAGPMKLGAVLAPGTTLYLLLPRLLMMGLSLSVVWAAWAMGARLSRLHALCAGFVAAIWYETVYFAPHIMSETLAVALILPAAALLVDRERADARRIALAGLLIGVAVSMRFQYLPAVAVLLLGTCGTRLRATWWPLLIGGLIGLAPAALVDAAMGRVPYAWMIANVRLNLVADRAAAYGVSGPFELVMALWPRWSLWGIGLIAAAAVGARRYPALAATAVVNFVFHSAIAHKEYRFVLLSAVLMVVLAGIGTADLIRGHARRHGAKAARERLAFAALLWIAASASLSFGAFRSQWFREQATLGAYADLRADPALCGLAVYREDFSMTPGYAVLHRDVPVLWFVSDLAIPPRQSLIRAAAAVNTVLTTAKHAGELPKGYVARSCSGSGPEAACVYRRPGGCDAAVGHDLTMNAVLRSLDD